MKKIFKRLLSGVLSSVLLASNVIVASAVDYEKYLPTINFVEKWNNEGCLDYVVPFEGDMYQYGFSYSNCSTTWPQNWGNTSDSQIHSIFLQGKLEDGVYPIKSLLISSDGTKTLAEKETGYYVDITVLPALKVRDDILFIKNDNPYIVNGEYTYNWTANLGSGYSDGEYWLHSTTNDSIHSTGNIFNGELTFSAYNLPSDTYRIPKEDVILQYSHCTGISPDGKTIYMEVTQTQNASGTNTNPTPEPEPTPEYIYNENDTGESMTIPTVNDVKNENQAVNKVQTAINQATEEQKQSATGIDKLTLLAEEAAAKANTVKLTDSNVSVTSANIKENTALQSTTDVLTSSNVNLERIARNIVNYDLGDTETINVKTEDVSNKVDAVRISTSYASATVNANTISDFTMTNKGEKTVEINFNKDTDTTVTVSFPNVNENDKYYAVVDENGNPVGGKYNPATGTLEAKLSESGIYKVVNNEKDFADIKDKSAEMQEAIKVLASKGIINGTTATTFAPDSTISRAEITALLMRTISLLDPNANGNFTDVNTNNWYCGAAGSAKEHNIINGYEDNTFRGNTVIAKDQIVAVSARTLKQQMNYKTPSDVAGELSVYADANNIANWAKEDVALATMTNLVLKRTDSTFSGSDGMTRGDAAIIMQRLFNKLW